MGPGVNTAPRHLNQTRKVRSRTVRERRTGDRSMQGGLNRTWRPGKSVHPLRTTNASAAGAVRLTAGGTRGIAEHIGLRPLAAHVASGHACARTVRHPTRPISGRGGRVGSAHQPTNPRRGVVDSYLVDPASSHMLVSKIKPCMSKYEYDLYYETADGSLNQL